MESEDPYNIFGEQLEQVSKGKKELVLNDVLKMSILEDNGEYKINLCHIPTLFFLDDDKDGKFTIANFAQLSRISELKEKEYKRYEFASQLQAYFTLLMWKDVCSEEGEDKFIKWMKCLLLESNTKNHNETDDSINPDPSKYVDRTNLRILYDVLNVKTTHGIDFQSFFELMKMTSDDKDEESAGYEEYVLISVLEFFSLNFIRGFSKLILDLGFDSFMETEFKRK